MLGALLIAYWFCMQLWWIFPHRSMRDSWMPLQLCDLAGLVGGLALVTNKSLAADDALLLGVRAFDTGLLHADRPRRSGHGAVLALLGEPHRDHRRGGLHRGGARVSAETARCAGGRRRLAGVRRRRAAARYLLRLELRVHGRLAPGRKTIIDSLGDWPWRLIPLVGIAIGAMIIVWLPWVLADKFGSKGADE